ncbi:MAG: sulfatase-like hydrolase/transferase [Sphingobacteriales bacterium]|jgi:hypothetical protein|nr:sulfatase-like hydrolase/transferase [Sphingobacteriales bacterium]OJW34023.1 MAG: hypothetical protein BGO54_04930 [Sphingobacteriales bacterium 46-32]
MENKRKLIYCYPWFALLLPVSFVVHGYVRYPDFVSGVTVLKLLLLYIATVSILSALAYCYFKNLTKSCLIASVLLAFNFYWGPVHDYLLHQFGAVWFTRQSVIWPIFVLALLYGIYRSKRSSGPGQRLISFINLIFVLFLLVDGANWFFARKKLLTIQDVNNELPVKLPAGSRPDIYLIILDEYAGQSSLKKGMQFENTDFLGALRSRDFFVADSSKSNYNATLYSMASLFSMNYMDLRGQDSTQVADVGIALQAIYDNRFATFLQQKAGYKILNNSWFRISNSTSMENPSYGPNEAAFINAQTLVNRFRRNSLLGVAHKLGWKSFERSLMSENEIYNRFVLDNIEKAVGMEADAPRFVYTHLSMPHYPYFNDKNGHAYSLDSLVVIKAGNQRAYLEYLQYANNAVLEKVDIILQQSKKPFCIILMSDHGFRRMENISFFEAAYSNLFAAYSSNRSLKGYAQDISNVNVFRVLLNDLFHTQLALVPDSTFKVQF